MYNKTLFNSQREADETVETMALVINGAFCKSLDELASGLGQHDKEIISKIEQIQEIAPEDTTPGALILRSMIASFYGGFGMGVEFARDVLEKGADAPQEPLTRGQKAGRTNHRRHEERKKKWEQESRDKAAAVEAARSILHDPAADPAAKLTAWNILEGKR